jgi:hypothetical protein
MTSDEIRALFGKLVEEFFVWEEGFEAELTDEQTVLEEFQNFIILTHLGHPLGG